MYLLVDFVAQLTIREEHQSKRSWMGIIAHVIHECMESCRILEPDEGVP